MLGKLKQWFSKEEPIASANEEDDLGLSDNPNFLTERTKINRLLCELEASSPLCTVQINGSDEEFSSSILNIKSDGSIILDELTPGHGNSLLQHSKSLKLSTYHKGIHLSFKLSRVEVGSSRGITYYKAALPDRVYYPQRRKSPRVEISTIDIPFNGIAQRTGLSVGGYLFDLSRDGAGITLPINRARLQRSDLIKNCQISFEDYVMDFDFVVRFVKPIAQGTTKTQIGGIFAGLSPKSQSKLTHFITSLERIEIRKQRDE